MPRKFSVDDASHYEIQKEIARGSWGVVYRAKKKSGERVAIKKLPADAAANVRIVICIVATHANIFLI